MFQKRWVDGLTRRTLYSDGSERRSLCVVGMPVKEAPRITIVGVDVAILCVVGAIDVVDRLYGGGFYMAGGEGEK